VLLYCGLITSYVYFNARLTDSEGEEVRVQDALHHFFTSPWWLDLKQSLQDTWNYAQHHGWIEVWKQVIDLSDPHGEINAYKVNTNTVLGTAFQKYSNEVFFFLCPQSTYLTIIHSQGR
jgi:hypothetical protein